MLNYKGAARRALRLLPGLALPVMIAACSTPRAEVPADVTAAAARKVVIDGNCAVDSQGRAKGKVSFNGWAVGNPKVAPESITVTIGNSEPITAALYDRPDIAKAYQTQALTQTGFRVEVDEAKAPAGSQVKIFANQIDKVHECPKTFTLK